MLREQGRIQNEIDHLSKERMVLKKEVDLAKFLREKVKNNESDLREVSNCFILTGDEQQQNLRPDRNDG
ncbi:MAG: hypothetical protein M0Z77_05595 [Thermoplasmatales archaeon]|jgi:hypothetical protein|nr:hypothetical protein [Thermoplasmatales archaeon]